MVLRLYAKDLLFFKERSTNIFYKSIQLISQQFYAN